MSEDMLKILCCPVSKRPVKILDKSMLGKLNELIEQGKIKDNDDQILETPLTDALITDDGETIYRIDDDIPVMLALAGIKAVQIS
ncbi:MAG: Trm112 family protein [candidate division Zixibacteria bacterium]|nr:Trm112 family protein [candidate division Zixibacteria bacterium]